MGAAELFLAIIPVVYLIGICILIFITRYIFSIPTFLKHQKAQTELLSEIAIEKGVAPKRINEIMSGLK
jgi:hypothetical protein